MPRVRYDSAIGACGPGQDSTTTSADRSGRTMRCVFARFRRTRSPTTPLPITATASPASPDIEPACHHTPPLQPRTGSDPRCGWWATSTTIRSGSWWPRASLELNRLPAAVLRRRATLATEAECTGNPHGQPHRCERSPDQLHEPETTGHAERTDRPPDARPPLVTAPNTLRANRGKPPWRLNGPRRDKHGGTAPRATRPSQRPDPTTEGGLRWG